MSNSPFRVGLSIRARRDLQEIRRYYNEVASTNVSENIYDRLLDAMLSLEENPERFPPEPLLVRHGNFRVLRIKKLPTKSSFWSPLRRLSSFAFYIRSGICSVF